MTKAEAYAKVREKIALRFGSNVAEEIFSEFEESGDERIRKDIIAFIKKRDRSGCDYDYDKWIAWLEKQKDTNVLIQEVSEKAYTEGMRVERKHWLEKQGEQKPILDFKASNWYVSKVDGKIHDLTYNPTDKVEPKFKVGEWVVNNEDGSVSQITGIVHDPGSNYYAYDCTDERFHSTSEKDYHLWTIQDAKDGDVLELDCGIGILKDRCIDDYNIHCYCYYSNEGLLEIDEDGLYDIYQSNPATKEQRDTLFAKINEAGYVWDAEKKELKLLISNGGDFETGNSEQNPAWSEDDEFVVKELGGILYNAYGISDDERETCTNWLKSIEGRVQPRQWSEEDIRNIQDIDSVLFYAKDLPEETCVRLRNWLKSLGPNKEMIEALRTEYEKGRADAINEIKSSWSKKDEDEFNEIIDELTPFGECPDNPDWEQREYYYGRDVMIKWLKTIRTRLGGK